MSFDEYEYFLPVHFICPIEYGDETGLTDDESEELAGWLESLPHAGRAGHWVFHETDEFSGNDVNGLMGETVRATFHAIKGE